LCFIAAVQKNIYFNVYIARWLLYSSSTAGYMFCCCFLFLTIPFRSIISKSTGPIFAKFARLVELWLYMINLKLGYFRSLKGRSVATNFCWLYPH